MGMTRQVAQFILKEQKHNPITGDVLTIGKQKMDMTPSDAAQLFAREGVAPAPIEQIQLDGSTVGSSGMTITDKTFFKLISDCDFHTLDISAYEGADVIHDLTEPLPDHLAEQHDFIFNGGCLDNVFDPAMAMRAFSRLLRPGGRIIHAEIGCLYPSSYIMYSTEWFLDYYIVNGFVDCKTYVALFDNWEDSWILIHWQPLHEGRFHFPELQTDKKVVILAVAEKGENSTWEKSPIQTHYRPSEVKDFYIEGAMRYARTDRPIIDTGIHPVDGFGLDHPCYSFCGFF